ncbi:MAG: beta-ketoacyl-ACP synthase III [Candidatus Marinimicrobia bacterium]|jgi:3-oxoacyl-[acyl-carrier-protein] synthase-3|nr:beta-ketoacyl-ACP synthase III [Candidatus Neomarinimicrobiota bacterium]MDP6593431.1 beta-ketoacyl-ACP synthase III [Candidatus Neomarinimicrobiota bacterium]MDP6836536.1 beta-ketoacyl-ACP synthase III [Candidatus Neomarinimicrobiota bacterium]|tara:strand:+ start:5350 stop:6348 length:999 start_codon:yes stop_codon:yes gene_type:complete
MRQSHITGIGHAVPENVVTNADLEKLMDTSDQWITERSGVKERHHVRSDEETGASDLGVQAAEIALEMAGVTPDDIDLIVFATISSDYFMPGSAVMVQEKMGMQHIGAFDVRAACSGFIYGLSIADQFIRTEMHDNVLLIGAEVQSVALKLDTEHRDLAVLFGDGAGAVVLQPSHDDAGVLSTHLHSDGSHLKDLWLPAPGSKYNPFNSKELIDKDLHVPYMNGREVFKNAVVRFPEVIHEALDHNGLTLNDVALIIPHQANYRISQAVAKRLGVGMDRVYSNIHKYGNTTAASIPIAMSEAYADGKISSGDIVILAAFGSGFTWASAAIRW